MYYLLNDFLKTVDDPKDLCEPYVAILNSAEWMKQIDDLHFDFNRDDVEMNLSHLTKIVFNAASICGAFLVPEHFDKEHAFGFVLDKKRIIFLDDNRFVENIIKKMSTKKNLFPTSSTGFFYDFIDELTEDDIEFFGKIEKELDDMEHELANRHHISSLRITQIRTILRNYMVYYEQLENALSEMIENENGLFEEELSQYFDLYSKRVERLYDFASNIREYSQEIRELHREMIDIRQNAINTAIAVVTTIFLPLNLIAGWYGMNFKYMPELQWPYSYYIVILLSITIIVVMLLIFKKRKWL